MNTKTNNIFNSLMMGALGCMVVYVAMQQSPKQNVQEQEIRLLIDDNGALINYTQLVGEHNSGLHHHHDHYNHMDCCFAEHDKVIINHYLLDDEENDEEDDNDDFGGDGDGDGDGEEEEDGEEDAAEIKWQSGQYGGNWPELGPEGP